MVRIVCGLLGCAVLWASPARAQHDIPDVVRRSGVIRVGSQQTFPPIEFRDDKTAQLKGLSVDLLSEAARRLGLKVQYIHGEYSSLISGIQAGRFDVASGGISDTVEREQTLDFVNYLNSGVGMLLQNTNPAAIHTIDDMCGRTIATLLGSRVIVGAVNEASQRCVARGRPRIRIDQFPATPDARLQLRLGRVDAYLADIPALAYLSLRFPGEYRIAGGNYVIVRYILSWGFAKSNPGLRNAVQAATQAMLRDGTYQRILERWNNGPAALPEITINMPASRRK